VSESESTGRRTLHFETIEELLAEIDRVVEADKAGQIRSLGAWTPGQILGHVAAWIEYGYVGFPMKRVPWLFRLTAAAPVEQVLKQGMPVGVQRIPGLPRAPTALDEMGTEEAAERLRLALGRLQRR
jgi:hypothetical protein